MRGERRGDGERAADDAEGLHLICLALNHTGCEHERQRGWTYMSTSEMVLMSIVIAVYHLADQSPNLLAVLLAKL